MSIVMYLVARASDGAPVGEYLKSANIEAYDGRGDCEGTLDINQAKRFDDMATAMKFWNSVPACRPIREDGKPNKPLTAFTVELQKI